MSNYYRRVVPVWVLFAFGLIVQAQPVFSSGLSSERSLEPGDRIIGQWVMPDGSALIEVYPVNDTYSVRIVQLRESRFTPADSVDSSFIGKPRVDIHNPDSDLQQQSLQGLVIARELEFNDGKWSGGKIYDPGSGKTYRCSLEWVDGDFLRVRGYIGLSLFGRTMYWQRAADFGNKTSEMMTGLSPTDAI